MDLKSLFCPVVRLCWNQISKTVKIQQLALNVGSDLQPYFLYSVIKWFLMWFLFRQSPFKTACVERTFNIYGLWLLLLNEKNGLLEKMFIFLTVR